MAATTNVLAPPASLRGAALKPGVPCRTAQHESRDPFARRHAPHTRDRAARLRRLRRCTGRPDVSLRRHATRSRRVPRATRHEVGDAQFDQAFTLLGAIGMGVATIVFLALPIVEGWIGIQAFARVGRALVLVLPIQLLGLVPMGRLERALNYRVIAPAELGGYVVFYLVALPLARAGTASGRQWRNTGRNRSSSPGRCSSPRSIGRDCGGIRGSCARW